MKLIFCLLAHSVYYPAIWPFFLFVPNLLSSTFLMQFFLLPLFQFSFYSLHSSFLPHIFIIRFFMKLVTNSLFPNFPKFQPFTPSLRPSFHSSSICSLHFISILPSLYTLQPPPSLSCPSLLSSSFLFLMYSSFPLVSFYFVPMYILPFDLLP